MALTCNITLNVSTCVAGGSPSPQATLQVFNPNASAVAVAGVQLQFFDAVTLLPIAAAANAPMPALGPGQTVVAPAGSSIFFGPFPVAIGLAGNASSLGSMPFSPSSPPAPANPQLALRPQQQVLIGAVVYGSDGSANVAGRAGLLVSYPSLPPLFSQGGALQLSNGNNFLTGLVMGVP